MRDYYVEKESELFGYKYVIILCSMGHRCAYVIVDTEDDTYKGYISKQDPDEDYSYSAYVAECNDNGYSMDAHGGITFERKNDSYPIDLEKEYMVIGFEAGHLGDKKDLDAIREHNEEQYELLKKYDYEQDGEIRDVYYMEQECIKVIAQIQSAQR